MFYYSDFFYKDIEKMKEDEKIVVPEIIKWLKPKSVIDFGCGEGQWLGEFIRQNKSIRILGLDGDYVNRDRLKIPKMNFLAVDLRKKIELNEYFDLAVSTEVAEHLEEEYADIYIDNITNTSEQVLFSAAVPGQRGTHHINEQWQNYWIEKFYKRGYYVDFSVRNFFWEDKRIESWRRQNLLFFSKRKGSVVKAEQIVNVIHPEERSRLKKEMQNEAEKYLNYYIQHPEIYTKLDAVIAKLICQYPNIVIYPYGLNGKLCEKILRFKYKSQNYIIADNYVCRENNHIIPAKELEKIKENFVVIETCGNPCIHEEVLTELKKYVNEEHICSVYPL